MQKAQHRGMNPALSVMDLQLSLIHIYNANPKPFIWTAKATDILAKVTRARAVLNKNTSN